MAPEAEHTLALLVVLAITGFAIYWLVRWVRSAAGTADPWGQEIEDAVNRDDAVQVCHHCLSPQTHHGWFCPECGATVGPYCNYMPYVYAFAQGEVLRAGTGERLRHSTVIVIGFVVVSLVFFPIVAPIYWYFLVKNLTRWEDAGTDAAPSGP